MLTDRQIMNISALGSTYGRGVEYFKYGKVKNLVLDNGSFKANVRGSYNYDVSVNFDSDNEVEDYQCDCAAYNQYDGACKHVVAVLKAIQNKWTAFFVKKSSASDVEIDNLIRKSILNKIKDGSLISNHQSKNILNQQPAPITKIPLTSSTRDLINFFNNESLNSEMPNMVMPPNVILSPTYNFSTKSGNKISKLDFKIGNDKMYVLKSVRNLIYSILNGGEITYGKNFVFTPSNAVYDENSALLIDIMKETYFEERSFMGWNYQYSSNSSFYEDRCFKLSNTNLLKFFEKMGENSFNASINYGAVFSTRIIEGRPPLSLDITSVDGGIKISIDLRGDVFYGLDMNFRYIYCKGLIYHVDTVFSKYIAPLMKCFSDNAKPEILIPIDKANEFHSTIIPAIEKIAEIRIDNTITNNFYRDELVIVVYFDKYKNGISAKVGFKYGTIEINPVKNSAHQDYGIDGRTLLRNIPEENKLLSLLKGFGFVATGDNFVQVNEDKTYDFLVSGILEINKFAEVYYSDEFRNIKIKNSGRVTAGVRLNSDKGLLEMKMEYEDMNPKELLDMMSSYRLKKRYHRLKNGNFVQLDSKEFQSVAELVEQLDLSHSDISKNIIELPKFRAMYIDSLSRENTDLHIERSSAFKKMVQDIREPQDVEYELPEGILGNLRDYQKIGFKWLKTLASYGMGGILADDMGLGKTLQVIAFVLDEKRLDKRPSIVVAPTSLIYNWQEEVKKFAPSLNIRVVCGTQAERRDQIKDLEECDLVVTSYGMIKRDLELYDNIQFKYCFIDEAQHIKNPSTLNAKSVKNIRATGYFALTGTPIENTLTELWSIFDFMMPGYLLSHNKFLTRFETPIVKNQNKDVLKELGRHIKPFILRRMKRDVLKELPEKIESKMTNEMTSEQRKIYTAYVMKAKKEFEEEITTNGFQKSQLKILAILTRLRQICCHPELFIDNYKGSSGKLEMLMEVIEDAIAGNHRILLFSQFTSMLSIIKRELDNKKISYYYLDGGTPAQERIKLVTAFNNGDKDAFLISLKAGGTGLNLTGADMVIHYDPWWNPAVEDQATDRAYRIGQMNAVQVIKLITKDTIEEKIFELQQKKKELIDSVISPGENFITKMTEEEIRKLFVVE